jgi:serine/threonine protein kinase
MLPRAKLAIIFYSLAHALAALHKARVIHRDLKPANSLLDDVPGDYLTGEFDDCGRLGIALVTFVSKARLA